MLSKQTSTNLQTVMLLMGFCLNAITVTAQSSASSAKQHLERALSYSSAKDLRAEEEYKQAIAARHGVYPEAWEAFSTHLSYALRFREAAAAWRKYLKQRKTKASPSELEHLKRLDRGASLRSRYEDRQSMSLD